jgi:hypothetical protein
MADSQTNYSGYSAADKLTSNNTTRGRHQLTTGTFWTCPRHRCYQECIKNTFLLGFLVNSAKWQFGLGNSAQAEITGRNSSGNSARPNFHCISARPNVHCISAWPIYHGISAWPICHGISAWPKSHGYTAEEATEVFGRFGIAEKSW